MSKYFRVLTDSSDRNTWLLNRPDDGSGSFKSFRLVYGEAFGDAVRFTTTTYNEGPRTDLHIGAGQIVYARPTIADALLSEPMAHIEALRVTVDGDPDAYRIINVLDVIECLDHERIAPVRSLFPAFVLPELIGERPMVRPVGHEGAVVVSERIKSLLQGATGIDFADA